MVRTAHSQAYSISDYTTGATNTKKSLTFACSEKTRFLLCHFKSSVFSPGGGGRLVTLLPRQAVHRPAQPLPSSTVGSSRAGFICVVKGGSLEPIAPWGRKHGHKRDNRVRRLPKTALPPSMQGRTARHAIKTVTNGVRLAVAEPPRQPHRVADVN